MHAIEYTCVRTNTRSALSDEFNFRVSCALFDIVLMCGMSHDRDVSDIFVCPTFVRSSVWWASCAVRAFISVQ